MLSILKKLTPAVYVVNHSRKTILSIPWFNVEELHIATQLMDQWKKERETPKSVHVEFAFRQSSVDALKKKYDGYKFI
jgi:hypothetical protein